MNKPKRPRDSKKQVPIRLTPDEHQDTAACAASDGRSVSNFVRHIYITGLAAYKARTATANVPQQLPY